MLRVFALSFSMLIVTIAMLPTQAVSVPGGEYARGVNLAGADFGEGKLPGTYDIDYTYPNVGELDYYRGKGLTLIRLPFRWERLQRQLYAPLDAEELKRIDAVVNGARDRGMSVILDPHNYARYYGNLIGSSAVPNAAFHDFWLRLAGHYKAHAGIHAYGLMNEPYNTAGLWPAAAQAGIDGIRASGSTQLIYIPGDQWSGAHSWLQHSVDLDQQVKDPINNMGFEAHQYFDNDSSGTYDQSYDGEAAYPMVGVDRVKPFVEWCNARGVRCFVGEYGVPHNDSRWLPVLDNFLAYLDSNGVSGTYWAGGPWWGDYILTVEPNNGIDRPQMSVLVKHLGQAAKPTPTIAPTSTPTTAPTSTPTATSTPTPVPSVELTCSRGEYTLSIVQDQRGTTLSLVCR